MPKLHILTGLPGSGKSTWARNLCNIQKNTYVVNMDSLREMFFGTYKFELSVEPMIKTVALFCVNNFLDLGYNVIVDETSITKAKRKVWLEIAKNSLTGRKEPVEAGIIWFTETEENLCNRMKGDSRGCTKEKWLEVIEGMKKSFEIPDPSEFTSIGLVPNIQKVSIRQNHDTSGWIGVDLDGTLAFYDGWKGEGVIGDPIPLMVNHVRMWVAAGEKVKIMTARAGTPEGIRAVQDWLVKHNIPAHDVTNVKDYKMKALYDDRAFRVEENTGIVFKN